MVDLGDKELTECEQEVSSSSSCSSNSVVINIYEVEKLKTCVDCGTTKTPLWRGGPAGPKSLCNACGIRSRKKRRALLSINKSSTEQKKSKNINTNRIISADTDSIKSKLLAFRVPMTWQKTKVRRKVGEEERAAMLLMALSCGSVY